MGTGSPSIGSPPGSPAEPVGDTVLPLARVTAIDIIGAINAKIFMSFNSLLMRLMFMFFTENSYRIDLICMFA